MSTTFEFNMLLANSNIAKILLMFYYLNQMAFLLEMELNSFPFIPRIPCYFVHFQKELLVFI